MPKKVQYIQCDSEECIKSGNPGRLSVIASTSLHWGSACGDGGDDDYFYECSNCKTIFQRSRYVSGCWIGDEPDSWDGFHVYRGQCSREELITLAPFTSGTFLSHNEGIVVDSRCLREKELKDLSRFKEAHLAEIGKKAIVINAFDPIPGTTLAAADVMLEDEDKTKITAWFDTKTLAPEKLDFVFVVTRKLQITSYSEAVCHFLQKCSDGKFRFKSDFDGNGIRHKMRY